MKDYIEERAVAIANYIIDHNATVRQTAKRFGISKSTVHKDCTERLISINPSLAAQTRVVLDLNKSERHIRGGMATREKYQHRLAICSRGNIRILTHLPPAKPPSGYLLALKLLWNGICQAAVLYLSLQRHFLRLKIKILHF